MVTPKPRVRLLLGFVRMKEHRELHPCWNEGRKNGDYGVIARRCGGRGRGGSWRQTPGCPEKKGGLARASPCALRCDLGAISPSGGKGEKAPARSTSFDQGDQHLPSRRRLTPTSLPRPVSPQSPGNLHTTSTMQAVAQKARRTGMWAGRLLRLWRCSDQAHMCLGAA